MRHLRTERGSGLVHGPAHRVGVGQVRLHHGVPAAGQPGRDLGGPGSRITVVDRDPVAEARERLGDRATDAARPPGYQHGPVSHGTRP